MKTIKVSDEVYDYLKGMIDDPNDNRDSDLANSIRIIQAMIDSSGTVEPAGGFDLEKARASIAHYRIENPSNVDTESALKELVDQANLAEDALAEIERLRSAIRTYREREESAFSEIEMKDEFLTRQNARINELEADLEQSERVVEARLDVIDQQAAKIRELEDAHKRSGVKYAKIINELRSSVYANIPGLKKQWDEILNAPANGKIGPDADAKPREGLYGKYCISKADGSPVDPNADYFVLRLDTDPVARRAAREYSYVTPDRDLARGLQDRLAKYDPQLKDCMNIQFFGLEKPHCWQITEERKAALWHAINVLKENDIMEEPEEHLWDEEVTVLQAMLTEADHDKP
jgi:hypothetical protein